MSALLALSDVTVMRALERAGSRGLSGETRRMLPAKGIAAHDAYRFAAIHPSRHTHALAGSWNITTELAWRWQLPVEAHEWAAVLDRYARDLLTSRAEHTLDELEAALRLLGVGHAIV